MKGRIDMMQIYIDAIKQSKIGDVQFVLVKSLDMVRLSDNREVLKHLKDGWKIAGKYNNGDGEYDYRITSEKEKEIITNLISNEFFGFEIKHADIISISFKEYFDDYCKLEKLIAYVSFHHLNNEKLETENFIFEDEKACKLQDIILTLGICQYKDMIIQILEKKIQIFNWNYAINQLQKMKYKIDILSDYAARVYYKDDTGRFTGLNTCDDTRQGYIEIAGKVQNIDEWIKNQI